jgi:hypothetical protein
MMQEHIKLKQWLPAFFASSVYSLFYFGQMELTPAIGGTGHDNPPPRTPVCYTENFVMDVSWFHYIIKCPWQLQKIKIVIIN